LHDGVVATSIVVSTVDNASLLRMEFEAAFLQPLSDTRRESLSFGLRSAMHHSIVCVSSPRIARKRPCHPVIEHVVQKEIRKHRTYDSALRSASCPFDQRSICVLERRLEPSLDVQNQP